MAADHQLTPPSAPTPTPLTPTQNSKCLDFVQGSSINLPSTLTSTKSLSKEITKVPTTSQAPPLSPNPNTKTIIPISCSQDPITIQHNPQEVSCPRPDPSNPTLSLASMLNPTPQQKPALLPEIQHTLDIRQKTQKLTKTNKKLEQHMLNLNKKVENHFKQKNSRTQGHPCGRQPWPGSIM